MVNPLCVSAIFQRGTTFVILFAFLDNEVVPQRSAFKEKNLLLEEQILSFKS